MCGHEVLKYISRCHLTAGRFRAIGRVYSLYWRWVCERIKRGQWWKCFSTIQIRLRGGKKNWILRPGFLQSQMWNPEYLPATRTWTHDPLFCSLMLIAERCNFVNVKCSVMLSVSNISTTDSQPSLLSASLSVLHLGRRGLEALEDWLYGWRMNNLREETDGTDRVSSPVKPWGSHRGPVHHAESYIKGRRRRRPGQGLSYRSPDIWLASMLQRQPATPVWQLYALHYCALMRSWITVKI